MAKSVVSTDLLMQPIAQFSFGMRAGDVVRIGATAGTDAARRMAGASLGLVDVSAQSGQMLENFETSLKLLGAGVDDVVHIRSWLNDWRDLAPYEAALKRRWPNVYACHSLVGSAGFPLPQAAVEAELIAIIGGARTAPDSPRLVPAPVHGVNAGVRVGSRHFCTVGPSGPAALNLPDDPAAQAQRCLDHLEIALDATGLQLRDVVMLNVNTNDPRCLPVFDQVLRQRLRPPYPARTVSGTSLVDSRWLFSVDSIAVAGGGSPIEAAGMNVAGEPASAAMLAGDELFIGGMTGLSGTGAHGESVEQQTHQAWSRIIELMSSAGMTADDILHTTNTLTDWRSYGAFNAAYGDYVRPPYPPRATVVSVVPDQRARVMIEAHAHRGARDGRFIGYAPPPPASPA